MTIRSPSDPALREPRRLPRDDRPAPNNYWRTYSARIFRRAGPRGRSAGSRGCVPIYRGPRRECRGAGTRSARVRSQTSSFAPGGRLAYGAPVENNYPGIADFHGGESFLIFIPFVAMRDHRLDIEPRFQHHTHFVPGFIHLPAVNTLQRQHVEDDVFPVDRNLARGNPEHGDFRAMAHIPEHFAERDGVAGHLQAYVESFVHAQLFLDIGNPCFGGIDR